MHLEVLDKLPKLIVNLDAFLITDLFDAHVEAEASGGLQSALRATALLAGILALEFHSFVTIIAGHSKHVAPAIGAVIARSLVLGVHRVAFIHKEHVRDFDRWHCLFSFWQFVNGITVLRVSRRSHLGPDLLRFSAPGGTDSPAAR